MSINPVVQELINKTFRELAEKEKPQERSRIAQSTNGYIHLVAWSNAELLRILVRIFTYHLPKSEYRLKAQMDDAARSVIANIEEGFRRPTTAEYLTFLGYSQASLTEVKGDIQRANQDNFLLSKPNTSLLSLHINLMDWHEKIKQSVISKPADNKGVYGNIKESTRKNLSINIFQTPLHPSNFLYPPVDNLKVNQLTYEIFIELINKTDWNLRKLVGSLEDKLNRDQKFYQVEKSRLRSNVQWNR